jgi:hypothetical protein
MTWARIAGNVFRDGLPIEMPAAPLVDIACRVGNALSTSKAFRTSTGASFRLLQSIVWRTAALAVAQQACGAA